jgi:hypothetical protein
MKKETYSIFRGQHEDEVGCNEGELGYRFTTEKIEAAHQAG